MKQITKTNARCLRALTLLGFTPALAFGAQAQTASGSQVASARGIASKRAAHGESSRLDPENRNGEKRNGANRKALSRSVLNHSGAPFRLAQSERIIAPPRPFPMPEPRPELGRELQLELQAARVEISGALARTHLTQTFRNTTGRTIEGTYIFPLPPGAAVSGFAMTINGKRTEAEILDGDRAREIYTGIVQKMRDPGILEFIDRDMVRARIFPIAPDARPVVELEYSETLRAEGGATSNTTSGATTSRAYRFMLPLRLPLGGAAKTASVDIRLRSGEGIRAVYSPTHEVQVKRDGDAARISGEFGASGIRRVSSRPHPGWTTDSPARVDDGHDRDFVLYYTTSRTPIGLNLVMQKGAGEDGYFMLLAAPDARVAPREIAAKDVIFVFDTSGSMQEDGKIEQARRALLTLLGNLNPNDRFNIVTFSSDTRAFRPQLAAMSTHALQEAREFVGGIKAVGGTNINDALLDALKMMTNQGRPQQIVFMTDGQPTVGETDIAQILKNVRAANSTPRSDPGSDRARLFTFGVGYDVNTRLLDTLAEDNRGTSDYVEPREDIEAKVGSLYAKIAYPVLANPSLQWDGLNVYDVYPRRLPDLFRGTQSVVFGRFRGAATKARVRMVGLAQGPMQNSDNTATASPGKAEGADDALPRLWAMRKVGWLMDDARRAGRPVAGEVKTEIIALGKRFGLVTPFTAALITEDEAPRFDRGDADSTFSRTYDGSQTGSRKSSANGAAGGMAGAPSILRRSGSPTYIDSAGGFGAASGENAVAASRATNAMRESETLRSETHVKYVEGKAFFERDGVWTDGLFDAAKSPPLQVVKFASKEYLALLKDRATAKWLSVGARVVIVLKDKTIRVEP